MVSYEWCMFLLEKRFMLVEVFVGLLVIEIIEIVFEEVKVELEVFEWIGEECIFEVDIILFKLIKCEIVCLKFKCKVDCSLVLVIVLVLL